mmetsp:Transcript_21057/g.21369  ORF Transcript_21057/g.21369 Transcript_21057/m.21369 type:complete len:232 (-) Transcript_21057:145-840(-)
MRCKGSFLFVAAVTSKFCQTNALSVSKKHEFIWDDDWDIDEIWDDLNCEDIFMESRPLHNESAWMFLRGAYLGAVGPKLSTIKISHGNSFTKNVMIDYVKDKGRGVIAQEHILEGEHVWSARDHTASFGDGFLFRKFLAAISIDVICDVIQWSYIETINGTFVLSVDLDDGSFMNSGGPSWGSEETNIGYDLARDSSRMGLFALKDIAVGEELLCDYDHFDKDEAWDHFGL